MTALFRVVYVLVALLLVGLDSIAGTSTAAGNTALEPANRAWETEHLQSMLRTQLERLYPGARIEFLGGLNVVSGALPENTVTAKLLADNGKGQAQFLVLGAQAGEQAEAWVDFSAKVEAWIAHRRVMPGEKLDPANFAKKEVNVAFGMARELRGAMLPVSENVSEYEARQTIVQGNFPLVNGVRKIPDVRRGDMVKVHLVSGEVMLMTAGTADEPAYVEGPVRVTTAKTKKQLLGTLKPQGVVEVQL